MVSFLMRTEIQRQARRPSYVALGSNLGDSPKIILDAMARLQNFSVAPILKSSLWRTSPVNCPPNSPRFVNAVVGLVPHKDETPESLLKKLRQLETEFGRAQKKIPNEPRPLDLDLIAFGSEVRNSPELILPHPRACERKFVLQPLSEIAPELILPGQKKMVLQLLAELPGEETVTRL
jgi:2-amino-4-hydroxy-6-hydroxymethyldihydropteridine diphosphokinase